MVKLFRRKDSEHHRRMAEAYKRKARGAAGLLSRPSEADNKEHWERELASAREAAAWHGALADRLESEGR